MIKFHQKYFIESILIEEVNSEQIRSNNAKFRNIRNTENKLTRFQLYPETELACKYKTSIYKTQYSEILVEYEDGFDMNTGHLIVSPMATSQPPTDGNPFSKISEKHRKNRWKIKTKRRR